jgi:hypothetical protein
VGGTPAVPGGVMGALTDRVMSLSTAIGDLGVKVELQLEAIETVAEAARSRPSVANLTEALGGELEQLAASIDELKRLVSGAGSVSDDDIDHEALGAIHEDIRGLYDALNREREIELDLTSSSLDTAIAAAIESSLDGLRRELQSIRRSLSTEVKGVSEGVTADIQELRDEVTKLKRRIAVRSEKSANRLDEADVERIAARVVSMFEASFDIAADT